MLKERTQTMQLSAYHWKSSPFEMTSASEYVACRSQSLPSVMKDGVSAEVLFTYHPRDAFLWKSKPLFSLFQYNLLWWNLTGEILPLPFRCDRVPDLERNEQLP